MLLATYPNEKYGKLWTHGEKLYGHDPYLTMKPMSGSCPTVNCTQVPQDSPVTDTYACLNTLSSYRSKNLVAKKPGEEGEVEEEQGGKEGEE